VVRFLDNYLGPNFMVTEIYPNIHCMPLPPEESLETVKNMLNNEF